MQETASLEQLAQQAALLDEQFERKHADDKKEKLVDFSEFKNLNEKTKKAYFKEFKKVTEASDVILEVLDARDPLGCRCYSVEQMILSKYPNKRIILVLNKIDLVPQDVLEKWLKFLRNFFPTILFKSVTGGQKQHGKYHNWRSVTKKSNECLGGDMLIQLLKKYSINCNKLSSITVGVVGYPNVGKSSLINSLKRSRVAEVGAMPGVTKTLQEIQLDKHVKLIDCPGIVFASGKITGDLVLRNVVKLQHIDDPIAPVEALLSKCPKDTLMRTYQIQNFDDTNEFLNLIARRHGKVLRGGLPDIKTASRLILQDLFSGKIKYFVLPPVTQVADLPFHLEASIVSQWNNEFSLTDEQVIRAEQSWLSSLPKSGDTDIVLQPAEDSSYREIETELAVEIMKDDIPPESGDLMGEDDDKFNLQINKKLKKKMKKERKLRKKGEDKDDKYDFSVMVESESDQGEDEENEAEDGGEDDEQLIDDLQIIGK